MRPRDRLSPTGVRLNLLARLVLVLSSVTFFACGSSSSLAVRSLDKGSAVDRMANFTESILAIIGRSGSSSEAIAAINDYCTAEVGNVGKIQAEVAALSEDEATAFANQLGERLRKIMDRAQTALEGKESLLSDMDVLTASKACSPIPADWQPPQ